MKWSLVVQCLSFFFCVYTSTQTEVTCTVPTIENAKTLKKPGTNIEYQCLHGYEPDRFTITCNEQGDWDNMRDCTAKTLDCGPPPSIEHALQVFKEQYKEGETATYVCPSNYVKDGDPYMICSRGRWIGKGKCLQINCLLGPPTPGTSTSPKGKNVFRVGESVEITCSERLWLYGTREIKRNIICKESGEWEHSPVCEEITCDIPYDQHVDYVHYYFSRDRRLGVEKPYRCESGYRAGARTATCTENGWLPNPLCTVKHDQPGTTPPKTSGKDCGRPPQIEDAVQDFKDRYEHGEKAAYDCPAFYKKEGYLTCTQGRWTGSGKCWKPCTVDLKAIDDRNIQLRHKYTEKIYSTHGDFIGFSCKSGYRPAEGSVPLRQSCNNGEIPLPVCE
ncbi:complement factor H-like isoform X2 [Colossoma macropomum]|uniref:complement factor H-like isoform X2 n=1 Tax=Colossoma macropomum TaxID=42526 RepID=UPI001864B8BC|nr:complement factor H-like isoform X2 [Colossoma macropomum]